MGIYNLGKHPEARKLNFVQKNENFEVNFNKSKCIDEQHDLSKSRCRVPLCQPAFLGRWRWRWRWRRGAFAAAKRRWNNCCSKRFGVVFENRRRSQLDRQRPQQSEPFFSDFVSSFSSWYLKRNELEKLSIKSYEKRKK